MDFENASTDAAEAQQLAVGVVGYRHSLPRDAAIASAARAVGIGKWSMWSLYYGRRKAVGYGVLAALRREYVRICEIQVRQLEAQLADLKRKDSGDASFENLGSAVARVVEQVRKARSTCE